MLPVRASSAPELLPHHTVPYLRTRDDSAAVEFVASLFSL